MQTFYLFLSRCLQWLLRGPALALPVVVTWLALGTTGLVLSGIVLAVWCYVHYVARQGVAWAVEVHNTLFYALFTVPVLALLISELVPLMAALVVFMMAHYCAEWLPSDLMGHKSMPVELAT